VEKSLTYYPKPHEAKVNSISMLTNREQTLTKKGLGHPMEHDKRRFKDLCGNRTQVMGQMSRAQSPLETS